MASVFTANSSSVLINGERVLGVRGIDFQHRRAQESIYAIGSSERVAVAYGGTAVAGRLVVASNTPALDALLASGEAFQVVANLSARADFSAERSMAFDDCRMTGKSLTLSAGGHAEAVYDFTATRLREEAV